jgi:hypothetical protein
MTQLDTILQKLYADRKKTFREAEIWEFLSWKFVTVVDWWNIPQSVDSIQSNIHITNLLVVKVDRPFIDGAAGAPEVGHEAVCSMYR